MLAMAYGDVLSVKLKEVGRGASGAHISFKRESSAAAAVKGLHDLTLLGARVSCVAQASPSAPCVTRWGAEEAAGGQDSGSRATGSTWTPTWPKRREEDSSDHHGSSKEDGNGHRWRPSWDDKDPKVRAPLPVGQQGA